MQSQEIERVDREYTYAYERDRINERVQIWTLFFSMAGAFAIVGLQNTSPQAAYALTLFPFFTSCFAQHIADAQVSLAGQHKFLYQQEVQAGATSGAQHFFRALARKAGGGNKKAMRKAFVVSSLLATALVVNHMRADHVSLLVILVVAAVELYFVGQIIFYLTYWKPILAKWKNLFSKAM